MWPQGLRRILASPLAPLEVVGPVTAKVPVGTHPGSLIRVQQYSQKENKVHNTEHYVNVFLIIASFRVTNRINAALSSAWKSRSNSIALATW